MPTPITVSVNFIDLTGNAILGYMQASIVSPTGVYDLYVAGTGIILPKIITSSIGTTVSVQIWGNDVVVDASDNAKDTYYTVNLFNTSNTLLWSASYLFTGAGPISLIGFPILNPVPPPPTVSNPIVTVPGGNNSDVQFNNGGVFGGSDNFTFNSGTNTAKLNGAVVAVTLPSGVDIGTTNALVVNPSPAVTLTLGSSFTFTTTNPNTGGVTLNASGLGIKNLLNEDGSALISGDILSGVVYGATYDGTEWLLNGFNSAPASTVAFNGNILLVSTDPGSGFNTAKGSPLTISVKNTPSTRQPLIAFGNPSASSGAFFGFDNDNVFVCSTIGCRIAFLSGTAPEIFDQVSIIQNSAFGGDDLFVQPSLGGANKSSGTMLNVKSGDGNSQLSFNFQNILAINTLAPATNVANFSSPNFQINGTYWTGSASAVDSYNFQNVVATGTNPSTTLLITHTGSSGAPLVSTGLIAFTCGSLHAGQTFFGGNVELTSAPATGGGNVSSTSFQLQSAWWDGSASHFSLTSIQDLEGSGTNPTDTTTISNSGAFAWAGVNIVGPLAATTGTFSGTLTAPPGALLTPGIMFNELGVNGIWSHSNAQVSIVANSVDAFSVVSNQIRVKAGLSIGWATDITANVNDTGLSRDSAAVIDVGNGSQGDKTGTINLTTLTAIGIVTGSTFSATGATPTGTGSNLGLGTTSGFGNGTAGQAVTTTLKNTGTGPTTSTTVVKYLEIDLGGTKYWIPLMQ